MDITVTGGGQEGAGVGGVEDDLLDGAAVALEDVGDALGVDVEDAGRLVAGAGSLGS